jgi:hypothetical protein
MCEGLISIVFFEARWQNPFVLTGTAEASTMSTA